MVDGYSSGPRTKRAQNPEQETYWRIGTVEFHHPLICGHKIIFGYREPEICSDLLRSMVIDFDDTGKCSKVWFKNSNWKNKLTGMKQ